MNNDRRNELIRELSKDNHKTLSSSVGKYIIERKALEVYPDEKRKKIENKQKELEQVKAEKIKKENERRLFSMLHAQYNNRKRQHR